MNLQRQLPFRLPLFLLALALLVVYHRLLLGESFVWGLPPLQFYPWREYALELLRSGQVPLWTPYNGAGAPLFANYQSALLYPFTWISFLTPLAPTMSITTVLHLFIAGWGMWAFTGRLGYGTLGRGISALAFGMTSYLVARLFTYPAIQAAAWLPWLMWGTLGIITTRRLLDVAWLALFTSLILLAGHAQTAWYSLLLTGLFALWRVLRERPLRPIIFGYLAAGVALGAAIAAPQLVATGELLLSSQRADGVAFDTAMNFSYNPLRLPNLISPNVLGTPADGTGAGAFFEDATYIGLVPLVSAIAALLFWWRTRRRSDRPAYFRDTGFWLIIIVVTLIFAFGRFTPVYPFIYNTIPTFDLFQAPARWNLWLVFGLSVLAGAGVAAWSRSLPARRWSARLTVICAALLIIGIMAPFAFEGGDNDTVRAILRGILMTGVIGTAAGILSLIQPVPTGSRHPIWALLVLLLVTFDMSWAAWGLQPTTAVNLSRQAGDASTARGYWTPQAEDAVKFDEFFRFDDFRIAVERWDEVRTSQLPNINLVDGVPLFNNFDPLLPGYHVQYRGLIEAQLRVDLNDGSADAAYTEVAGWNATARRLLLAANVGYGYTQTGERVPLPEQPARAWLLASACWHADDAAVTAALLADEWQPRKQVQLSGEGDCPSIDSEPIGQVLAIDDRTHELLISVEVARDGWLVVADTYYPGWQVEVNGRPTTIERANLAFRAVALTPEAQTIRFIYRPGWLLPGAIIGVVSLLALLVLFRVGRTKSLQS
ncbi:MAG: YfhO family protein [Chloroflexota bacterium]|nr:YfhO family protein [Chloroflexota bacterium]